MKIEAMNGYKLFKEREDGSIHMIRILWVYKKMNKPVEEIKVFDYDTNKSYNVKVSNLSDYSPLEPDGIFTACVANVYDSNNNLNKDVLCSVTHYRKLKNKEVMMPYAVCRQNITDVFYNLLAPDEDHMMVGVSISQDTCPANFDFGIMFATDGIEYDDFVNFYINDTLDDIYELLNTKKYNDVLRDNYIRHIKHDNNMDSAFALEDYGWCKDLKTLWSSNNFQTDIDMMLGVTSVDFTISEYLDKKLAASGNNYMVADNDLKSWLSLQYKIPIKEATFLEYDHDINLDDFKNTTYLLLRDDTKKLYLVVYTCDGEFFEDDLKREAEEGDFTTKFKLKYYNKYNSYNKDL